MTDFSDSWQVVRYIAVWRLWRNIMGKIIGTDNVAIGIQNFEKIIKSKCLYIDKTSFIKEWWESGDDVTLITRPRRFGKTLNMSMLEHFFSVEYAGRGELFEELSIWEDVKYRELQGTYPVLSLSFANVKANNYETTKMMIYQILVDLYEKNQFLMEDEVLSEGEKRFFKSVNMEMPEYVATSAIHKLACFLYKYYGKRVVILLDEYDTPMQEAYVSGYWNELVAFTRSMFNSAFKTNPYLERAVMTGITRVSKESIFSDLNNLEVVTTTSDKYAEAFGFTEEEVFSALEICGHGDKKEGVKSWYDGFIFGSHADIYNPWSVLNFLDKGTYATYWANTSGNSLVGKLIKEGGSEIKSTFEELLRGKTISCPIDEQIVYNQLDDNEEAIWSLLLASGYLKVCDYDRYDDFNYGEEMQYVLTLTNGEVRGMFNSMIRNWFQPTKKYYNGFVKALLSDDVEEMNLYMNRVSKDIFSYFDTGVNPSELEPERFYHGFVLGLIVDLSDKYIITSNRESGYGRYDVIIESKNPLENAVIIEFKVRNPRKEDSLQDTVQAALNQINAKQYEAGLLARGFEREKISKYGFAFEGKKVLIG